MPLPDDDKSAVSETGTFGGLLKEIAKTPSDRASSPSNLVGVTLRQFQVQALLGRGGMGIVYRAQDTRLGRRVALKVLRHGPADNPDSRRRFLREARSAAAIAHPNIAAVYEVEEAEGHVFLVMELIEGETLRERLRSGPLPVAETVRIGKAIARGLAKAHEKGIVHRDLKPENVMITREGDVKILDFGLAKIVSEPSTRSELENQATETNLTEEGAVIGTLAYMSPEQASGAPLDPRSDMFSVGVVLYEMVTGRRPFDGTTRQELLAALLGAEPLPPSKHNDSVGPELDRLILQCLRKKPEERLASAVDLLSGLEGSAALPRRSRKRARGALLVSAGALAAAAVVMSIVPRHVQPVPAIASTEVASAAAAPAPVVTRIIDLPPPATQVPAAAAAYAAGLQAVHDDNWFKALGLFTQAAQLDPTMAAAHLYLSLGSLVMNSPPTRRAEYEKAAGLRAQLSDRDRALLEALQPLLQSATQDVDEGDRRLRALTARYPGDVEIWTLLGAIHYVTSASLAPSERALELDPGDAQSIEDKGHAALVLGKYADARGDYARCGSLTIDGADCFAWSGIAYGLEGQCADYEREERRAADRNPFWGLAVLWAMASTGRNATTLEETEKQALAALPPPLNDAAPYFGAGIEVRLAILSGDFARAAVLAKQESAIVAAVPELRDTYTPHYDLTSQLLEIALETGDDAGARRLVSDFLAHSDAWPFEALLGHGVDLSLYFARLAQPNGQPPPDFEVQRTAWTQRALFAGADRGQVWDYAYASPALTPSEAETALAALPAWGPPSPAPANIDNFFGRMGSPEADLGRVYLLAGQVDQAIEHLTRAVARCDLYTSTLDHLRAALNLGTALEQKGDTKGACDAYGKVLAQWGHAKPKSVTADAARGRAKALGCSGL